MPENFVTNYDQKLCDLFKKIYSFIDVMYEKIKREPNELEKLKLIEEYQKRTKKLKEEIKITENQRQKAKNKPLQKEFKYFSNLLERSNESVYNELLSYHVKKDYYEKIDSEIANIASKTVLSYTLGRITKAENIAIYSNLRIIYSLINNLHNEIYDDTIDTGTKVSDIASYDEMIDSYWQIINDFKHEYGSLKESAKNIDIENIDLAAINLIDRALMKTTYGEISNIMSNETAYENLMNWKEKEYPHEEFNARMKSVSITTAEKKYHQLLEADFKQLLVYLLEKRTNDEVINKFKKEKKLADSNIKLLVLNKKIITYIQEHYESSYQVDSAFKYSVKQNKMRKAS